MLSTVVPYHRIGTSELQFVCAMDGFAMVRSVRCGRRGGCISIVRWLNGGALSLLTPTLLLFLLLLLLLLLL